MPSRNMSWNTAASSRQKWTKSCKVVSNSGGTRCWSLAEDRILGTVQLKDIVKGGMRERFDQLRAMGIRTVMITGDNPLTAAAIAREAGR